MAKDQITENALIAVTTTAKNATFTGGIQRVYMTADADCFVSFDENVAVANSSFLLKANLKPAEFNFEGGNIQKVWAITAAGTANLYLLGVRR